MGQRLRRILDFWCPFYGYINALGRITSHNNITINEEEYSALVPLRIFTAIDETFKRNPMLSGNLEVYGLIILGQCLHLLQHYY